MKNSTFKRNPNAKGLKRGGFKSTPKAMKPKSAKKAAYRSSSEGKAAMLYMRAVKCLNCAHCGAAGPSDAHHVFHDRYGTAKASDWDVIPLCKLCHQDGPNAIHKIKRTWLEKHGPDHQHIPETARQVKAMFGIDRGAHVKETPKSVHSEDRM